MCVCVPFIALTPANSAGGAGGGFGGFGGFGGWRALLTNDYWGVAMTNPLSHKSYRPITVATFRLNCMLAGLDAAHFHATNAALHALVWCAPLPFAFCFLLVLLLLLLLFALF